MQRLHLWVSGQVQGVFFRASTRDRARELGLSGFVKNLPDGRVEIVAEGESQALDQLIVWAKQGPPHARVEDVTIQREEPTHEFSHFGVRY